MTEYVLSQDPLIKLVHGDSMEYLRRCRPKEFDLAITDPPYGIYASSHRENNRSKLAVSKSYHKALWDQPRATRKFFRRLRAKTSNQIIFGANHFISELPIDSSGWIVWDKMNGNSSYSDCELAWTSFDRGVRKFNCRWSGMMQYDMANKEVRIHPTQKPLPSWTENNTRMGVQWLRRSPRMSWDATVCV